ncbi:N6-adenosine-methyltransferase catalytic subunit-like [Sycon ciliatum]|uniref:N6-adenosine-methyltransferase catalytic subunit-like n=1 Tax=Sycon ciliatum TaxID=27933 RepID=UPI0031F6420C|eukprot:scpid6763/ scgid34593/ N6-adenosine-methyltransferase 70 kDa subunit; Methyltransferase-like protein 3
MSDTFEGINAIRQRQTNLRDRLEKRKQQRKALEAGSTSTPQPDAAADVATSTPVVAEEPLASSTSVSKQAQGVATSTAVALDATVEHVVIRWLCDPAVVPVQASAICERLQRTSEEGADISLDAVKQTLRKFALQSLLSLSSGDDTSVVSVDLTKLCAMRDSGGGTSTASGADNTAIQSQKRPAPGPVDDPSTRKVARTESADDLDIDSLLQSSSVKETESQKLGQEINELLSSKTTKELSLMEKFKSQGGTRLKEFCKHGTKIECRRQRRSQYACENLHFRRIIRSHTDESLGDCSFLNTCFHVDTCKFVHYEVDYARDTPAGAGQTSSAYGGGDSAALADSTIEHKLYPAQWVNCDIRTLDFTVLGKFSVVMADPPWDIHMELPYGTMSDDEMLRMNVTTLQDEGYIFLWVTGRAMELGRSCLDKWGYKRCDELIWVKTNQLQRLIRTGRTGHWLNHGKEHCLIGYKGSPGRTYTFNKGLDCDVLVAEVRATSHKPDEVYGLIERLAPGSRKCELFGRQHNVQPNWVTLGNQLDGVRLVDPDMVERYKKAYPDGNCMKKSTGSS